MSDNKKNANYKKDTELFRNKIHEAIDKVAASLSSSDTLPVDEAPTILSGSSSKEILDFLNSRIEEVKPIIDTLLNDVREKVEKLNKMAEKSEVDIAWRPQTGVVNLNPIEVNYLKQNKEILQTMIKKTKKKTDDLKKEIFDERQSYWRKLDKATRASSS